MKVGVRVTVAPYSGLVVLATRLTTTGAATTLMLAVPAGAEAPAALVTVQVSVVVPTAPAVKVIAVVPWPAVMEPLLSVHT